MRTLMALIFTVVLTGPVLAANPDPYVTSPDGEEQWTHTFPIEEGR